MMIPTATNFDPLANTNDGSCTYPVPGCMDASLNNSGGNAATNYNPLATTDDGSCTYVMPALYNAVPQGMQAPLLNTVGWTATTLWAGLYRIVFAVWDVSASPTINKNNLQFAWENSTDCDVAAGCNPGISGDITNFSLLGMAQWFYSNDGGASWSNGTNFTNGDPIQLIRFRTSPSGVVEFLPSATRAALYPPTAGNGAQQQAAKIGFTNANIPTHTTSVETYNVMLGCNDSSAWAGYTSAIPFYDNDGLCATAGTVDNIVVTSITSNTTSTAWRVNANIDWDYLFPANESTWDTTTYGAYPTPNDYEWQFDGTTSNGTSANFFSGSYSTTSFGTTTNPPISVQRFAYYNPSGGWNHFRVRWRKTINSAIVMGPWVDHWVQTP